ncbi:hypothetical protein [Providencia stuartii]|uniref:hypothetical protein n=1 Tax=Providencia stuartii TaxID=588 RepID=UPI0034E5A09A
MSYLVLLNNADDTPFTIDADSAKEVDGEVVFSKEGAVVSRISMSDIRSYIPL